MKTAFHNRTVQFSIIIHITWYIALGYLAPRTSSQKHRPHTFENTMVSKTAALVSSVLKPYAKFTHKPTGLSLGSEYQMLAAYAPQQCPLLISSLEILLESALVK